MGSVLTRAGRCFAAVTRSRASFPSAGSDTGSRISPGARLAAGGRRPAHLPAGNYLAPTVLADVRPEMRIFREEIFGPVVCVTPFDTEADAIRLANDTR